MFVLVVLFLLYRCVDPDEDRVAVVLGGYIDWSIGLDKNIEVYSTNNVPGNNSGECNVRYCEAVL